MTTPLTTEQLEAIRRRCERDRYNRLASGIWWLSDIEALLAEIERLRTRDELASMLMDVLLGIGGMFGLSIPEMAEDPSLIVTRIEQAIGPRKRR